MWIAAGMLLDDDCVEANDVVALLRATAYSDGRSVDEVVSDLLESRLTARQLHERGG